jgi:hypothetical protein
MKRWILGEGPAQRTGGCGFWPSILVGGEATAGGPAPLYVQNADQQDRHRDCFPDEGKRKGNFVAKSAYSP